MSIDLMAAILIGDRERATALLDAGADVNFRKRAVWRSAIEMAKEHPEFAPAILNMNRDGDSLIFWTWTPLLLACERGQWDIAADLLARDADADYCDEHFRSPLTFCVRAAESELVRELLIRGADPNRATVEGITPLHLAAGFGGSAIMFMELYLTGAKSVRSSEDGPPPDTIARFRDIVAILIEFGADVNAASGKGSTAVILVAEQGWTDGVRLLLKSGASLDCKAEFAGTPLMAALPFHLDTARILIEQGADVNQVSRSGSTPLSYTIGVDAGAIRRLISRPIRTAIPKDNKFPFIDFSQLKQPKVEPPPEEDLAALELLLDNGADPNQPIENEFGSPLIAAARRDAPKAIRLLVERGADVNGRDKQGRTALMMAAFEGHPRALTALLECGADYTLRSNGGNTALMSASLPSRHERMLAKADEIAQRPRGDDINEAFDKIESLREKLGEHGKNIPTLAQAEQHFSAFREFLKSSIGDQMQKGQSGREKVIKILKGAGATA